MTLSIIATTSGLIEDIKKKDLPSNEIKERVSILSKMVFNNPASGDPGEIHHELTVLINTLKKIYDFKTRDAFITQAIDKVIQTCNTLSSKNQLVPSLPAEVLFTVIDKLPFSTNSDVKKVLAVLKEMEPKGKPPPDVKNYHKHLMDSFIIKINESAVPLKYFDEETLKWLVPELLHLNLIGVKTSEFLYAYRPQKAKTFSFSATDFATFPEETQEAIFPQITHLDLKDAFSQDWFYEFLYKAENVKTYSSVHGSVLAGLSIEEIKKVAPKITGLQLSDQDLNDEQFAALMENCINLRHLSILTGARSFPDSWLFTKQLKTLSCVGCRELEKLPNNMVKLEELDCTWCCNLEKLPDNMSVLKRLYCGYSSIRRVPDNMPQLELIGYESYDSIPPLNIPSGCRWTGTVRIFSQIEKI